MIFTFHEEILFFKTWVQMPERDLIVNFRPNILILTPTPLILSKIHRRKTEYMATKNHHMTSGWKKNLIESFEKVFCRFGTLCGGIFLCNKTRRKHPHIWNHTHIHTYKNTHRNPHENTLTQRHTHKHTHTHPNSHIWGHSHIYTLTHTHMYIATHILRHIHIPWDTLLHTLSLFNAVSTISDPHIHTHSDTLTPT